VGGIFWTDFSMDFPSSFGAHKIRQIVGHTRVRLGKNYIAKDGSWRIICMDTSISRGYGQGGWLSYLALDPKKPTIWYAKKEDGQWHQMQLA
jgi:hypothetical protein